MERRAALSPEDGRQTGRWETRGFSSTVKALWALTRSGLLPEMVEMRERWRIWRISPPEILSTIPRLVRLYGFDPRPARANFGYRVCPCGETKSIHQNSSRQTTEWSRCTALCSSSGVEVADQIQAI